MDAYSSINGPFADTQGYINGKVIPIRPMTQLYRTDSKGKLIPIEPLAEGYEIDDEVYYILWKELRAKTPSEVKTIVRLDWSEKIVGQYGKGKMSQAAGIWLCDVTVIDKAEQKVVVRKHFEGGKPPQSKRVTTSGRGSKPIKEIGKYLNHLPRR